MTYQTKRLEEWLGLAQKAARQAGFFLSSMKKRNNVRSEVLRDVKILADIKSEKIIIDILKKETDFHIFSEERGLRYGSHQGNLSWIVDPLDGTLNFLRGIPVSCVSIGLWEDHKPLLGVVYDFNKGEFFTGIVGKGAWLNSVKMKVSLVSKKKDAVLCTGFPAGSDFSTKGLGEFVKQVQDYKKVRLLGSGPVSLAYVAAGRADVYLENNIMRWDMAAGVALVKAAGGEARIKPSACKDSFLVSASNQQLSKAV